MKRLNINTKKIGYKNQDSTPVIFVYHYETAKEILFPELFSELAENIVFDIFEVAGLDKLASNFESIDCSPEESKSLVKEHMQEIVKKYLRGYDDLKLVTQPKDKK